MKHNFMTKMASALLAVVLSTAAFSVTAFASGGEGSTESMACLLYTSPSPRDRG